MAKAPEPAVASAGTDIFFELEQFERADGHFRLSGRWFGVRGRRFMRPSLSFAIAGERTRALADLDDKPWAAEDGEPWTAAFPWGKGGRVQEPELSVAPDITIQLPVPGARRGRVQRIAAMPRRDAMTASWGEFGTAVEVEPAAVEKPEPQPAPEPREEPTAPEPAAETRPPEPAPEALRAEIDRLRAQLSEATEAARVAGVELESLRGELSSVSGELEEAMRRLGGRSGELDTAQADLAGAQAAREAARRSAAQAEAEREAALTRATEAEAERDALAAEKAELAAAVERTQVAAERLTKERDDAVASRGAALVMRAATQALPAYERHVGWHRRVLVLVVLIGVAVAALIVLGVF